MNYTKQIFDMLGVDKDEEFLIKGDCTKSIYQISGILVVYMREPKSDCWQVSPVDLRLLLTGARTIVKIPHPTERDREILGACKVLGLEYAVRDKNGKPFAYAKKPIKKVNYGYWYAEGMYLRIDTLTPDDLAFIRWEDDEPVNIGEVLG